MDEERQETADWRIVWQMFFPCVISDLIGGCVEVLGHLNGNMGRIVSSLLTVVGFSTNRRTTSISTPWNGWKTF